MDNLTDILADRGKEYGDFSSECELIQSIKRTLRSGPKWVIMDDAQKEALDMVAHKMGRIINGNPNNIDSWRDIAGYTTLIVDRIKGNNY